MLNTVIEASIRNRVVVVILFLSLALLGAHSFQRLPIDAVPDITNVQVQINSKASGLSTLQIEKQITFPIERAMSGLPRLEQVRSISRFGFSQITVVFEDGTDVYLARQLVAERLRQASSEMPSGITQPEMGPISTGLGEIFLWTVEAAKDARTEEGQPYSLTDLRVIQDWTIRPQMLTVSGVAEINSIGCFERQIHMEPYPEKLLSYGMTFQDVLSALEKNNGFAGGGYIEHRGEQYIIQASGLISSLEEIATVPLRTVDGIPVFVRDVATVHFGNAPRTGAATLNGEETVIGTAMMLIGENSRAVALKLAEKLERINKSLPRGISVKPIYNRTTLVNATIATVQKKFTRRCVASYCDSISCPW